MWAATSLFFLIVLILFYFRQRQQNQAFEKIQQELKDREKQYRALIETASVVVWEMDQSTKQFTYMSPQVENLTGFPIDLWTDFDFWVSRVHPQDRQWASSYFLDEIQKGMDYSFEYRLITSQGETIWLRDDVIVIRHADKSVTLRGYFIDNTKVKLAELKLQENEKWLSQVMDTLPYGIQECDIKGKITYSNIAHHRILAVPEGELTGQYVWTFIADDRQKNEMLDYMAYLVREQPVPEMYQVKNITHDGREIELEVKWDYQRNSKGDVDGFISIISDITERKQIQDKLKKSEKNLANAQKIAHVGSWELELSDHSLIWSDEVFRIFEFPPEQSVASYQSYVNAIHPDDREMVRKDFIETLNNDRTYEINYRLLMPDGRIKYVLERGKTEFGNNDEPVRSIGIVIDLTDYMEAENALRKSEERFQSFAETAADLFWEMDDNLRFTFVSGKVEKLMGQGIDSVIGKTRLELYGEQDLLETPEFKVHLKLLESHQSFSDFEITWKRPDGEMRYIAVSGTPMFKDNNVFIGYRGVSRDVTDNRLAKEKILQQAHFDSLTTLPNRFLSLDRLTQLLMDAKRNNEKVAVLFLDLDDFKKVNDSLGHETGDKLLIEAAERLMQVVRQGDTVGRLGGDEFIVLLGNLDWASDARPIAENLLYRFRDAFKIGQRDLMITASVGIAIYPDDGINSSELLRKADSAMYHSKELGRNTYSYFTEEMNRDVIRRLALEEQIHGALERGEFSIYYQPKFDVNNSRIMGAEALLRWTNPALGKVSPAEFIPIAEQTGVIVLLGQFVLEQALKQACQWQSQFNMEFCIAVNLSPRQFRDPDLVRYIGKILNDSSLKSETLELEITEGVLMSGHSYIDHALKSLSEMNISLAMDDFGTGYSSLSYLRLYPFDVLKIDQSFVRGITEDPADRELINATIVMAHGLNLKVVAEGVETTEQFSYLKNLQCDYVQGYLLGKPMTDTDLSERLKKESKK